jgi:SAM-dependent methyltransferase
LLYQLAVQAPAEDAALFARWFRRATGRPLHLLREDFCGTAAIVCAFVVGGQERKAIGVDHDAATLAWARSRNLAALPPKARTRVQLHCADVHAVRSPRADLIVALNFSYSVFHQRAELLRYLKASRRALRPGGAVLLDVFGGGLAHRPFAERHRHRGFDHVWEQRAFDPSTHRVDCRIHFELPDGRRLRDAFVYDWRMWTVPELVDLMHEAGFARTQVLWQDPASGSFRVRRQPAADPHWLAYVAGLRS